MYAIREFEDAIDDCTTCTANCNEYSTNDAGPVHAWDEGVAFYTGSLEGPLQGGNSAGKMVYRLAEKRCSNFGTCTGAGGMSQVNDALFKAGGLFPQGRDLLHKGSCRARSATRGRLDRPRTPPACSPTTWPQTRSPRTRRRARRSPRPCCRSCTLATLPRPRWSKTT